MGRRWHSRPSSRGRQAGRVPKRPSGHDRTGVRQATPYSFVKKLRSVSAALSCYSRLESRSPIGRDTIAGTALRNRAKVQLNAKKERMVHRISKDGRELPKGAPQALPYGPVYGKRGSQMDQPLPCKNRKGRWRGKRQSLNNWSRSTATPRGGDPTGTRVPACTSEHRSRAR